MESTRHIKRRKYSAKDVRDGEVLFDKTGDGQKPLVLVKDLVETSLWEPFLEDEARRSYSYVLKAEGSLFTPDELKRWFDSLHPDKVSVSQGSWTDAHYKGNMLLRKTAWCVLTPKDCTCEYGYSDTWQPQITHPVMYKLLQEITARVQEVCGLDSKNTGIKLDCVNLNWYPRGGGVGFHADDEFLFDGLNRDTAIVSLSLCSGPDTGTRKFQVKLKKSSGHVYEVDLGHGDLMTMEGHFQKHYLHSVWPGDNTSYTDHPLTQGERINLTWRTIARHLDGSEECQGLRCPLA